MIWSTMPEAKGVWGLDGRAECAHLYGFGYAGQAR